MNKYIATFSLFFILSCNNLAGRDEKNDFDLIKSSKVIVDESEVVHSRMPQSLSLINDSTLACLIDYKTVVIYNISTAKVLNTYTTDSLLLRSNFDIIRFIKEHCIPAYPERNYILDKTEIASLAIPSQTFNIVSLIHTLDSVKLLLSIPTPYKQGYEYKGVQTIATVLSSSLLIADVNLNCGIINKIIPVSDTNIQLNNKTYPEPNFGSLFSNNKLYMALYPDLTKPEQGSEVGVFDLSGALSFNTILENYPSVFIENPKKWLPRKHFAVNVNGNIFFNSLFDIYKINADLTADKVVELKSKFRVVNYEHINCFAELKNGDFIIQSIVADSGKYYYDFRFYNPDTDELSPSKLRVITKTISPNVIFRDNKIIFFSKDEEHYYIETYKIVGA